VNLAARVAAQANGGQILVTKSIVTYSTKQIRPMLRLSIKAWFSLKNLPEPVDLYEIILPGFSHEYAIDPVCKMQVDKRRAAGELHFNDVKYWFCSLSCVERFAKELLRMFVWIRARLESGGCNNHQSVYVVQL